MELNRAIILFVGVGILVFISGIMVSLLTQSVIPFVFTTLLGVLLIIGKPLFDSYNQGRNKAEAVNYMEQLYGAERIEQLKKKLEAKYAGRHIPDGAPFYIEVIKDELKIPDFTPERYQTFEPYGIFMLELPENHLYDQKKTYVQLSITGHHAMQIIGCTPADSWDTAKDELLNDGQAGLVNAKYIEFRSPVLEQLMRRGMTLDGGN